MTPAFVRKEIQSSTLSSTWVLEGDRHVRCFTEVVAGADGQEVFFYDGCEDLGEKDHHFKLRVIEAHSARKKMCAIGAH